MQESLQMGVTEDKLSEEEVKRRLKVWFLAGNNPVTASFYKWPAGKFRTSHLKYGGYRLRELAKDVPNFYDSYTDAELDAECETYK